MKPIRTVGALVAAVPLALVLATPAAAGETYHGVFTGVAYVNADPAVTAPAVSGTWTVVVRDGHAAVLTVTILTDGKHHVSFGAPAEPVVVEGATFAVGMDTLAGPLVVSLTGTTLSYTIAPYSYGGLIADSVTYTGTLR